jgi:alpha-beta hydrolase superfamily lysophospholipase
MTGCIIHGLGEHAGRYDSEIQFLIEHSSTREMITWDHAGHGKSTGKRGDAPGGMRGFVRQTARILAEYPGIDWVWGHSLGAQIVFDMLVHARGLPPAMRAVVLSAPPFVLAQQPTWLQGLALPLLTGVYPQLTLGSHLSPKQISTLSVEQKKYASDPLIHDRVSIRVYKTLLRSILGYKTHLMDILKKFTQLKLMFAHGALDPIAKPDYQSILQNGLLRQTETLQGRVLFKVYERSSHEVHHDRDREMFLMDVIAFVS